MAELDAANEIVHHETDFATCKRIAQALADARAGGVADGLKIAAAWCDSCADLYDAYRGRAEAEGDEPQATRMQGHFMTMAEAAKTIRALKGTK